LIQGVCFLIHKATKVFLGVSSVLSNGAVVGKMGTSMIACIANNNKVPVVVFSETYKFSDKVNLDAINNNELGNPNSIANNTLQ
jgi:translation initiation factor eIF-2B subunit delta